MKTSRSLNVYTLVLAVALIISLSNFTPATADTLEFRSYLIDLNTKTATELGTLGSGSTDATDINDTGQVVGSSTMPGSNDSHAFITGPDGVGMRDLGTLSSVGVEDDFSRSIGINETGQVVGVSVTSGGEYHAFVTGPNGMGMKDLNSLVDLPNGVVLDRAEAINNVGQVVAVGLVLVVPEPQAYAMFLAGLGLIGLIGRFKKRVSSKT